MTGDRTQQLMDRAAKVIPGGVTSGRRRIDPPLVVREASGAHLTDADGRCLTDYYGDAGAAILGHGDPLVSARIAEAAARGLHAGVGVSKAEIKLAERLTTLVPSADQVLLCNSGSEATAYAFRLARAATGRPLVVRMTGSYHGWHDGVAAPSPGVLPATSAATLRCRYNEPTELAGLLDAHAGQVAGLIVEPIVHNCGPTVLPDPGYLARLRRICDNRGIVLIFDEVVTGIRHHLGGVQAIENVTPDLTTMGKALGNGAPIGVLAGRRNLMEQFNTTEDGRVTFAGTFNGNGVATAAALAVLERLKDGTVHEHINHLGALMRKGLQEIADRAGVEATATGHGSVFTLWFGPPPRSHLDVQRADLSLFVRYRRELRERGHFEKPDVDGGRSVISAAHTADDVDTTLEAADAALQAALRHQD
jgi:glutamate-1-semialdehyde 2,1-aminomutase